MASIKDLENQFNQTLNGLQLPASPLELYDPIRYTLANGGKRMRPLLVLLGCKIYNDDVSNALHPAIAIELFHNFTLLHDDIMDNAPLRRGMPSVHKKWNDNIAILSGDAMLIKAFQHLAETRAEILPRIISEFNKTALEVCEGQQLDMNFELRDDVSIDEYLDMIRMKTAVLLATSLKIGGLIGGANPQQTDLLYDFGVKAGIAFQLQDDILDVYGESQKVGKKKGGDIVANKKTFLLLKAQELTSDKQSVELNTLLQITNDEEKVKAVTTLYNELGVRELAEQKMWESYNAGLESLKQISGNPEWIELLSEFSHSLMHRDN